MTNTTVGSGAGEFRLDTRLVADGPVIARLPLCTVILKDDARWPWLVLVPRHLAAREVFDLPPDAQGRLMAEVAATARVMAVQPRVHKVNVGALGNIVPQLHIHVVGRWPGDPAWPGPVWGFGTAVPYRPDDLHTHATAFSSALEQAAP